MASVLKESSFLDYFGPSSVILFVKLYTLNVILTVAASWNGLVSFWRTNGSVEVV